MRPVWTDSQLKTLRKMASDGFSSGMIAPAVGKTRMAVVGKCDREGIQLHGRVCQPSTADRNRVATHCIHGHPFNEENTYHWIMKNGRPARSCRKCQNSRYRDRRKTS